MTKGKVSYRQISMFEGGNVKDHITETRLFAMSQVLAVHGEILIEKMKIVNTDSPIFKELRDAVTVLQGSIDSYHKMFKEDK